MNDFKNCTAINECDLNGNPSGGNVCGVGFVITWQNGPLGRGKERKRANGAFVETIISAAKQRLEFYQTASKGKFACTENEMAIIYLEQALVCLNRRTKEREQREVEGTHNV